MRTERKRIGNLTVCGLLGLLLTLTAGQAAAVPVFTEYLNAAAWQAAVGSFLTEDFQDAILLPGLSFVLIGENHDIGIGSGKFNDRVTPSGQGGCTVPAGCHTTWTFATPIYAWGGTWDLSPGGPGKGIDVFADGFAVFTNPSIENSTVNGFWGFVSDTPFTTVALFADGQLSGIQETHTLDDMVYAPVPEPATLLLLGSGMAGMALRRRRRN